jgi:histidinol-phosphate aminotransferase
MENSSINVNNWVRGHILEMPPYEPILPLDVLSAQLGIPVEQIVKLDANENPYGLLPEVRAALSSLPYAHIYPDPESRLLRQALAVTYNVPARNLLAGAGADELIDLVMRACLEPGDALINCPPTFGMYAFDGDVNRARIINVPRKNDFSLDIDALEAAITWHRPRLLFLASPNNPDGSLLPEEMVERLLAMPVLLILDEAYVEFAAPGSSWLTQVTRRENLVVLRTFSKWAGLAGLRIGFGAFPEWLIPHLWKIKQPYNVSVAASTAAIVSLQHKGKLEVVGEKIIQERRRLLAMLQAVPWLEPYPSQANFILCRMVGGDALRLKQDLARVGILIRHFNKPGLQDHIRISVSTPEHTDILMKFLDGYQPFK